MSIRIKLPLLLFCAFIVNIVLVYGYYTLFLSNEISNFNTKVYQQLQQETDSIAKEISNQKDFTHTLEYIAQEKAWLIQVSDTNGTVFYTGDDSGVNVKNSAASLFHQGEQVYLLEVTQPLSVKDISAYHIAWSIFIAEFVIIFIILFLSAIPIYFSYVKPIISLQRNMEHYKVGILPKSVPRRDEIGLLQNRFVALTEAINEEKQKQILIIASISHDIKTPLTSIMGFAERLKKSSLPPDRHEQYINIIYNKSVTIKNLIEEFDEYLNLHIRSGIKQQRISVENFCAILRSDYEVELMEKGVAFSVNVSCPDTFIFVDVPKVRRVFGNIISNSLKHFSLQAPSIAIFCWKQDDAVIFSVDDNGTGIADDELHKVFDPFYTSDKGRSVAGLGLSICKESVEACGGEIWAENNSAGGTSIKIRFPV